VTASKERNVTTVLVLATEAESAPSLKSELVTLVAQKAISLAIALVLTEPKQPKNFRPLLLFFSPSLSNG